MAEKCQHADTGSGILCNCPHFVARLNLTSAEVNTCDRCLHTVAWHRIPDSSAGSTSTGSNSTALSVDEILASFTSQAASSSGDMRIQTRGKKRKALEAEARQEAISGLKCSQAKGAIEDPRRYVVLSIHINIISLDNHVCV